MSCCDQRGCKNIKFLSELFSFVVLGILSGLSMHGMHRKWHRLGREAYLTHASQTFDKLYSNPSSPIKLILLGVVMMLLSFAFFKAIAIFIEKILSVFASKNETIQPPTAI